MSGYGLTDIWHHNITSQNSMIELFILHGWHSDTMVFKKESQSNNTKFKKGHFYHPNKGKTPEKIDQVNL